MMFEDLGLLEAPFGLNEAQTLFDAPIDDHYALQTSLETNTWQQNELFVDKNDNQDISLESLCKSDLFNPSLDECQDAFVLKDELSELPLTPDSVQDGSQHCLEDTDTLIEEMEVFLREHEINNITENESANNFDEISLDTTSNDNEKTACNEKEEKMELSNELLMEGVSNISSMVTDSGEHVIIIVTEAPKSPCSPFSTTSATEESSSENESVATPESGRNCGRTGRRRGPHRATPYHHVQDRKERKKLQNVAAARRYREKKRGEQHNVLGEEQQLVERNAELSSKLNEMQREANTLRRLMHELGITKIPMALAV